MSTTIEITCHGSTKVQPIAHAICRIGSGSGLELCMPGIESHAATLRIQNGKRQIYNRSTRTIKLNGKPILPEQTTQWNENQLLELADGVSLRLLAAKDESKAKSKTNAVTSATAANDPLPNVSVSDKRSRQLTIAGFFLVFATILFSSDSSSKERAVAEQFSSAIAALLEAEKEGGKRGRYQQIRIDLQNAFLREDLKDTALENVNKILAKPSSGQNPEVESLVRSFVQTFSKSI